MAKIIKTTDATGKLVDKRVVSLNIVERHDVIKYAHNLPSTMATFFPFGQFVDLFEFTDEEQKQYGIRYEDGKIVSNAPDLVFDIDITAAPEGIMDAIRLRVGEYKKEIARLREANKNIKGYTDSPLLTAIVNTLSKLLTDAELSEIDVKNNMKEPSLAERLGEKKPSGNPVFTLIKNGIKK